MIAPLPPADSALREELAIRIRSALDALCSVCHRPVASERDWEDIPEGEGDHLCWDPNACGWHELVPLEKVAADAALAVFAAHLGQQQAAIQRVEALHTPGRDSGDDIDWCTACTTAWPCATVAALGADL